MRDDFLWEKNPAFLDNIDRPWSNFTLLHGKDSVPHFLNDANIQDIMDSVSQYHYYNLFVTLRSKLQSVITSDAITYDPLQSVAMRIHQQGIACTSSVSSRQESQDFYDIDEKKCMYLSHSLHITVSSP